MLRRYSLQKYGKMKNIAHTRASSTRFEVDNNGDDDVENDNDSMKIMIMIMDTMVMTIIMIFKR